MKESIYIETFREAEDKGNAEKGDDRLDDVLYEAVALNADSLS